MVGGPDTTVRTGGGTHDMKQRFHREASSNGAASGFPLPPQWYNGASIAQFRQKRKRETLLSFPSAFQLQFLFVAILSSLLNQDKILLYQKFRSLKYYKGH